MCDIDVVICNDVLMICKSFVCVTYNMNVFSLKTIRKKI